MLEWEVPLIVILLSVIWIMRIMCTWDASVTDHFTGITGTSVRQTE